MLSTQKSLTIRAADENERQSWCADLRSCIQEVTTDYSVDAEAVASEFPCTFVTVTAAHVPPSDHECMPDCSRQRKRDIRRSNSVAFNMMTGTLQQLQQHAYAQQQPGTGPSAPAPAAAAASAAVTSLAAAATTSDILARRSSLAPVTGLSTVPSSIGASAANVSPVKNDAKPLTTGAAAHPRLRSPTAVPTAPVEAPPAAVNPQSSSQASGSGNKDAVTPYSTPSRPTAASVAAPPRAPAVSVDVSQDTAAAAAAANGAGTGASAVVWQADAESVQCGVCSKAFTLVRRIHHCRQVSAPANVVCCCIG